MQPENFLNKIFKNVQIKYSKIHEANIAEDTFFWVDDIA